MNEEKENVREQEVENEEAKIDVNAHTKYRSFTYDIDFIGMNIKLTQEKSIVNFGYDSLEICFMLVEIKEQYSGIDEAKIYEQRTQMNLISNLTSKGIVILCRIHQSREVVDKRSSYKL